MQSSPGCNRGYFLRISPNCEKNANTGCNPEKAKKDMRAKQLSATLVTV